MSSPSSPSDFDDEFITNMINSFQTKKKDQPNCESKTKRKKKSRWASTNDATEGKTCIPGMPTILPSNLNPDQQEAYLGEYKN